jgi:hypothetical protein
MLRILFSRAALFPWLGLALMATGAAFPENQGAALVLVIIGANVAFYSLHDFSQNFAWGHQSRSMLRLCGVLFPVGLALTASAAQFESLNRWLAMLCAGIYLCLFTVWTAQQPVSWPYRLLAFAGVMLMFGGGIVGYLGWQYWRVFAESDQAPQEISLIDLQRNGFGNNRFVRLREFRFCDRFAAEKPDQKSSVQDAWYPVLAVDGRILKKDGPAPAVPARVVAVASLPMLSSGGLPPIGRNPLDAWKKNRETDGFECTVVTGIRSLKPEIRRQISEMAPQSDFAEMIVLDWHTPGSPSRVYGLLGVGATMLLLGLFAIFAVFARASKVVAGSRKPLESIEQ